MKEKSYYIILFLTFVSVVAGGLLAYFSAYTAPYIAADKKKQLEQAILDVVPGAVKSRTVKEVGDFKVYEGLDGDGKSLGYAVFAVGPGFSDKISLIFGMDAKREKITLMRVLEQKDTPGLGAKVADEESFLKFWRERDLTKGEILLAKPPKEASSLKPNEVNAISGATISSRGVVAIVNGAVAQLKKEVP